MEGKGITNYDTLRAVLRARRIELRMSQLDLDEKAGLQNGYTGKIEAGVRNFGATSLPCMLGALGLVLVPIRSDATYAENTCESWASANSGEIRQKKIGAKGGRARARNLTKEQRSKAALKAIKARWDKHRAGKAKTERERRPRGSADAALNPA